LDPEIFEVISLWRFCRPMPGMIGGMAGGIIPTTPLLLEGRGVLDEGAWITAAFDILDACRAERMAKR
jgi:hypothetical protein